MHSAKSPAARRSVTFTLRQELWASSKTNRLAVPLRRYSQSKRSNCPGLGGMGWRTSPISWVGLSSKQTTGRLGSGDLSVEVEHVLHAGDVFGIHLEDAPHVFAPGLEVVFRKPAAHGFAGEAFVLGQFDKLVGQQLKRPAS